MQPSRPMLPLLMLLLPACFVPAGRSAPAPKTTPVKHQGATIAVPVPLAGQGYKLVKDWDFGTTVGNKRQLYDQFYTRYVYDHGTQDTLNDEWEHYRDNDNHVFGGHVLKLTARIVDGMKTGGIESGMLRSKWTGEYGYFECSMKVPPGRGMWPTFWLSAQDGKWPPEIDVMEIVNNGSDTTKNSFHNLHGGKQDPPSDIATVLDKNGSYHPPFDYADGFHTFGALWTPDTVTHYVDGVQIAKRRMKWRHSDGSEAGPAHVLVNLAVGGAWPGPPQTQEQFPAVLAIKYIHVWQKAGE